jgi:DNA helicase HerA-like ATPase
MPDPDALHVPPDAPPRPEDAAGVVLGSEDAGPLDFWVGVHDRQLVQLDDLVVVECPAPGAGPVRFYGIVDVVRKRYEGAEFDTDAFRAAAGVLPVEVSYAAHVQTTRIDPETFMPPDPGTPVRVVRGTDFQKALHIDRMEKKIAIGLMRTSEPVCANLEFLDGTRGAHASISGVSGVAAKTSYATFLLYSLFHGPELGIEAANTKALIFNVKGEDLLWLDRPNTRLRDEDRQEYTRLGLPAGPFQSVGLFAPVRRAGAVPMPDTGTRQEGVLPYCWTVRDFARDGLLRFAFADAEDGRSQIGFVITQVERELERAARQGDPDDPGLDLFGQRLDLFGDLVEVVSDHLEGMTRNAATATLDAFRRRLHAAARHMGHLVRGGAEAGRHRINWDTNQVTVIDIHRLHGTAQMFVVGVVLKRMMERKEAQGTARPLVFVLLDELNKYAPRAGWSPIQDVLLDIAERGRSLGVSLLGAQQTASEVERRVVANAALKAVGRLDAAEAEHGEYGFLTPVARRRATLLSPGTMIVSQPEVPTPLLLHFPFPSWATRESEARGATGPGASDPFVRLGGA